MKKSMPSNRQECNEILFKKFSELANAKMETEPERNEKMMVATAEEITQLMSERNLTVGEARSVLDKVERTISRNVEEMPVGINADAIEKMQAECRRGEKRRQRTRRLLVAFSEQNPQNEAKNQGFELPYRS